MYLTVCFQFASQCFSVRQAFNCMSVSTFDLSKISDMLCWWDIQDPPLKTDKSETFIFDTHVLSSSQDFPTYRWGKQEA